MQEPPDVVDVIDEVKPDWIRRQMLISNQSYKCALLSLRDEKVLFRFYSISLCFELY